MTPSATSRSSSPRRRARGQRSCASKSGTRCTRTTSAWTITRSTTAWASSFTTTRCWHSRWAFLCRRRPPQIRAAGPSSVVRRAAASQRAAAAMPLRSPRACGRLGRAGSAVAATRILLHLYC